MHKKISTLSILFVALTLSLPFFSQANAQTIIVSGIAFEQDETTAITGKNNIIVRIKLGGNGDYSTTLDSGDGTYSIDNILATPGTALIVFLDTDQPTSEKGSTVTMAAGDNIGNLHIYQNHVIARVDSGANITIADMELYDNDDNSNIKFIADASGGCLGLTLTVDDGNPSTLSEFYIWPGTNFYGHIGYLILYVEDIEIQGTYSHDSEIYVSGSWNNLLGNVTAVPAVTFNATSGTHYITSGNTLFDVITFNDGGGGATWVLEDGLDVDTNLNITSGTLDTKPTENYSINVEGSWTNSAGTFEARNGTVILDNDAANSSTITSGGSPFYNLVIEPTPAATYTLLDTLEVNNNLTISAGTLDTNSDEDNAIYVAGDWAKDNPATFEARSGTVTFDGTGAQNVTTGGSNWSGLVVTNASASGVTFVDKFTCETFTCTTPGAHLNFKYRETDEAFVITASGGLTLQGDSGDYVYLGRYGGIDPDKWYLNPSGGSWNVNYVDVANSFNSHRLYINPLIYNDSSDNNYNWFTQEECITQPYPSYSYINSGQLISFSASNGGDCGLEPSYSWEVASTIIGSAINVDGIYASGDNDTGTPVEDTVTVTDTANGVSDSATVCVGKEDCEITLSPSSQTVSSGEAIQFMAEKNAACNLGASYSWKVEGTLGSSVNGSGLYTAGTNSTPNDITETVTVTDSNNCALATATITVKGASAVTTTIPVFPTTTTIPLITTTTTTTPITSTSTTTTTIVCEISINPQSVSVNPGDTVTFEASSTGDCDIPDYEWVLSSSTDSSIDPQGAICIYTAGANESSETLTDIITLTDNANGDITVSATVKVESTVSPPSMVLSPDTMIRSRWLLIPVLMFFEGTNTHFDPSSSVITFDPDDSVLALPPLVINDTNICSLLLVMPSWLTGTENETVTVTVTTGAEVVSDIFEIEMLPLILDNDKILE